MLSLERPVNKIIPAPNNMENIPRMVPSKNMEVVHHAARLGPVAPPETVGSRYACGKPNPVMFMSKIPQRETPRMISTELIRFMFPVGVRFPANDIGIGLVRMMVGAIGTV